MVLKEFKTELSTGINNATNTQYAARYYISSVVLVRQTCIIILKLRIIMEELVLELSFK
jgi:hypothetical protein